jgi:putative ABC transport system permease protein
MNLSTSRSTLRAKEIGIRKVAGAERKEIVFQFLSESILVSYISLVFGDRSYMGGTALVK